MTYDGKPLAHASSDAEDRFLRSDEPLADLQIRCGGELPGTIAIPELMELVREVRISGLSRSAMFHAQDGNDSIKAWVDIIPDRHRQGCEIAVRTWQTAPLPQEDSVAAEKRRAITDRHLAELFAYLDGQQRLLSVSSMTDELQPLARRMAQGLGQVWTQFLSPENAQHQPLLHWRLLDGTRVDVPGSLRSWRVALIPQMLPGRAPTGFELLLLSDEPAGLQGVKVLPHAAEPKRELLGRDLASVLKQPITRIIANAETIRTRLAGPLPDAYAVHAEEIVGAGKLLLGLLDDMADLEVIEAENFTTIPDAIDLAEVVRQAAGILNVRAREKGIHLLVPDEDTHVPAKAEFRRVLQVLINLISNAIRYSPEGSLVTISLETEGNWASVHVADQGPGLSPEQQVKVFNKFERLGRSSDGGSGLGLYISRKLAQAMHGVLHVESTLGDGAKFTLSVPADVM